MQHMFTRQIKTRTKNSPFRISERAHSCDILCAFWSQQIFHIFTHFTVLYTKNKNPFASYLQHVCNTLSLIIQGKHTYTHTCRECRDREKEAIAQYVIFELFPQDGK